MKLDTMSPFSLKHWKEVLNPGLVAKLLLSALVVLLTMVGGLTLAINSTFDTNLSSYLLRVETQQVEPLADLLGKEYERAGNWNFLFLSRAAWPELVSRVLDKSSSLSSDDPHMTHDTIGMLPRLSVMDAHGRMVMRSPLPPRVDANSSKLVKLPIIAAGQQVGTLQMLPTPVPVKGLDQQFSKDQLHAFYLAALPALIFTLLIAIPLGYHFARPLQQMMQRIHALAKGDYADRLPVERSDELGQLAKDINHLADTLERTEQQRRQGMASVSHELRTPLSTMIAEVEAMQDGIRPLNAQQLQHLSASMDHLNYLVDDLYQLALADVGALVCNREALLWESVIEEAIESAHQKLANRHLQLIRKLTADVVIAGDPVRLRQVIVNLLENCCRYTRSPGEVTVSLHRENGKGVLIVSDTGPGVTPEKLEALFDRFFRVEASRSRKYGGAGLGLALVKAIVEAHGGTVQAYNVPHGGLAVRVDIALLKDLPEETYG